ncbi:MAG: hypothetical protein IJA44_00285 [Clostridia bacterium]|nr:hypothetical protein [Clostridia bacterium]
MTKKIIALVLALVMVLGVAGCGKYVETKVEVPADNSAAKDPVYETQTFTESDPEVLNLNVENNKVFNSKWNGVNAINQGFMFLPDEYGRNYSDAQIEEELKRMDDMDVGMVRSYMDAGFAFKERNGDQVIYDWDSERMQAFYKWLDAMEERDIEVAVNMGWGIGSIANATTQDHLKYTIPWYISGQLNIYSDMLDMYSDWVKLFIEEVIIKRGYDIEYFVMFTEPYHFNEYTFYVAPGKKETKNAWEVTVDVIQATDKKLKDEGLRDMVKLTGPQYGLSKDFYEGETLEEEINWWISRIDDYIDVYTFHWYIPTWPGSGTINSAASVYDDNYDLWVYYFEEFVRIISKTGKPFWFDEWMYGGNAIENQKTDFYAQQIAQTVIAAMNSGVNSCIYWQMFEIVWPTRTDTGGEFKEGIHILGTAPSLYTSAIPYKLFYGYSLLTRFAGEFSNNKIYYAEGENGVCLSMVEYEKDGKKYQNVIVVNSTSMEQKISINFKKSIGKNMYRYCFDPVTIKPNTSAEMIDADKGFKNVDKVLQDTIPAGSITVYSTVKE